MNYNEVKSILRKYFILCFFSVFVLVVLFAIFSIVLHRMWATIALMLLFYVIGRIIIQKITNHYKGMPRVFVLYVIKIKIS